MKKLLMILFLCMLSFTLVACNDDDKDPTEPKQTNTAENPGDDEKDTVKPVIKGAYTTEIDVGSAFDPLDGVTAEDDVDGDITNKIQVSGDYDVNKPGTYTIVYTVTDEAGNTTTVNRKLVVRSTGMLINPRFDEPLENGWNIYVGDGAQASGSIVDGEVKIVIGQIGPHNWSIQFEQTGVTLQQGKKYTISFDARADEPRSVGVLMEDPNNNYYKYGDIVIDLTTEMVTYNLNIEIDTATISTGKFAFMLGNVNSKSIPTTVYIDNVIMKEVTEFEDTIPPTLHGVDDIVINIGTTFDPLEGVTVTDDVDKDLTIDDIDVEGTVDTSTEGVYELTYTVTDAAGNTRTVKRKVTVKTLVYTDTEEIENGDFSVKESITADHANETGWREWHHNEGQQVSYQIQDGVLVVSIGNIGWTAAGWSIQLQQPGIKLEQGKTYALKFDAQSSIPRDIEVTFKTTGDYPYVIQPIKLNPTMKTFEVRFTVNDGTNDQMVLSINMGRVNDNTPESTQIILDNFVLYTITEG